MEQQLPVYPKFTKEMKHTHKILIPNMLPIHWTLLRDALEDEGYDAEVLTTTGPEIAQEGLKYVHNDTCYPALLVIGQFICALKSGKYDLQHTALLITQTGGGCRASNYIHLLRKALVKADFGNVPVASLNFSGLEKDSGFSLTVPLLRKVVSAVFYGDELMCLANQVRPYEQTPGAADAVVARWLRVLAAQYDGKRGITKRDMRRNFAAIAADFAAVPVHWCPRVKVGVVGEIYVKYASFANNGLEKFLAEQGCEVMVPGLLGFLMFKVDARIQDFLIYGGSRVKYLVATKLLNYLEKIEQVFMESVEKFSDFMQLSAYQDTKEPMKGLIGLGNRMGEGWFLPAEMVELIVHGYENIICTQPFGCLPTHVCGKGMIHKIKDRYPGANIVPVDYDPGATRVNQENRIKLMLAVAKEKLCEA